MLVQLAQNQNNALPLRQLVHADFGEDDASSDAGRSHTIKIAFDRISVLISVHRARQHDFTGPADLLVGARALRPPQGDSVQVSVVSAPLYDHLDRIQAGAGRDNVMIVDPRFAHDPAIAQLVRALVASHEVKQGLGALHADAIGLAIVTRLLGMRDMARLPATDRPRSALQKWRLKRVVEYVDTHLARPITLPDLAAAAGLTRMHFAAQFRAAVGMRPRHYVLRRRIDRAQELLRNPELALVEVALRVGFQTQAHFTTVFRRFAGETPHRWRRTVLGA